MEVRPFYSGEKRLNLFIMLEKMITMQSNKKDIYI
jgi:hypothetical protein